MTIEKKKNVPAKKDNKPAPKVAVAKTTEPKGNYPDYKAPDLTGAHRPAGKTARAKGMAPGDIVIGNEIVGLVPGANALPRCNASKTKNALESGEMTAAQKPNQGWTAACDGSRVGPDLMGTGGGFLVGSPSEMTYGVRQIQGYNRHGNMHRCLVTRLAWEAVYFTTIGAFDRITDAHRNAIVPLERWLEPAGDPRKDKDFAYLGDEK